nr:hypothetical protein [Arcicella sp.]
KHEQKVKFKPKNKKDDGVKDDFGLRIKPTNNEDIDLKEQSFVFNFSKPIKTYDLTKIQLTNDTITTIEVGEKNIKWNNEKTELKISVSAKKPKEFVRLKLLKGTFISVDNDTTQNYSAIHPMRDPENYGIISGTVTNKNKKGFVVQLLDEKFEVIQKVANIEQYQFGFVKAGSYYIRLVVDENKNGEWDAGDLEKNILPEEIKIIQDKIKLKQNFELTGYDFKID